MKNLAFISLLLILTAPLQAETKYLLFNTLAEAQAKELELRSSTKCVNAVTKTTRYADIIVNKDGTALLPIEPVYNHETKQVVNTENVLLSAPEKSSLLAKTAKTVTDSIDKDASAVPK